MMPCAHVHIGGRPATLTVVGDYMPAMQSYWKPEPDELAMLAAGAHVRLTVYGQGHPPVWVDVEKCDALIERAPAKEGGQTNP